MSQIHYREQVVDWCVGSDLCPRGCGARIPWWRPTTRYARDFKPDPQRPSYRLCADCTARAFQRRQQATSRTPARRPIVPTSGT